MLKAAALAVLVAGLPATAAATAPDADSGARVALVVNQSSGDQGPIDDMIAGLERVEAEEGADTTFVEVLDPAAYESGLRTVGNEGYDVVVVAFPQISDALAQVAPDFPDTEWIHIYGEGDELDNVVTLSFASQQGVYLAGVFAAAVSESGQLGYVGGASIPSLNANFNAFAAGAEAQGVTDVTPTWADSFEDPAKGRDLANGLFSDGADVVMMDGAATDQGVLEAAEQNDGMAIGFTSALFEDHVDVVPAAVNVRWGGLLFQQVAASLDGEFAAGHVEITLADGVFDLEVNDGFTEAADEGLQARIETATGLVDEARQAIIDGDLVVEYNPDL